MENSAEPTRHRRQLLEQCAHLRLRGDVRLYVANPGDRRTEARQFLALGPRRTASGDDHLTSAVRQ